MHELSIAVNILEIASEQLRRQGAKRVTRVHLKLGPLSGVVKDALLSAYGLARELDGCHDSELVIEETPLVIFCQACRSEQPAISIQELACSRCNAPAREVVTGRELEVVALEIQ